MTVSVRSYLTVGVAALAAGAVAVAPVHAPAPQSISTAAVRLSAAVQPLVQPANVAAAVLGLVNTPAPVTPKAAAATSTGTAQAAVTANNAASDTIINAYNAIEPWVQWGFEVAAWAVGYVPYAGYFGSQINIAYSTGEPIVGSWVYSFAYLIGGQVSLIGPTLINGVKQSVTNLVQGEINWILGYLPPLPPIPPFAATAPSTAAASAAAAVVGAPSAVRRNVSPTHALRTRIATAVEDTVAPATDAVEGTPKTIADLPDVKAGPTDHSKADTTPTDTPKTGTRDAVKDTVNSVRDTAKKVRSATGSASDHSEKKRAAHPSGE